MTAAFVRERYKLIRTLREETEYVCAEAVDILSREKASCLLNLYSGSLLRAYLPDFQRLEGFRDFQGMFLEEGRLVTVFSLPQGTPIDQVFFWRDKHEWQTRLTFAGQLMEQVLRLEDAAPSIGCPALLSENVLVRETEQRISLRFQILPMTRLNTMDTVDLACSQLRKILRPRFGSPAAELEFWEVLDERTCTSPVQLYALWTRWRERLQEAYETLEKTPAFQRWMHLLRLWLRWNWKQRRR